jgi:hypothetical protein
LSETVAFCGVMVTLMDAAYLFAAFLLPRLTANKATSIGAVLDFTFKEGEMSIVAETSKESSASTVKYAAIIKVGKKDDDVYLFISKRQGYIVDISELSEIERDALKALVTSHLPARKVKWK